MKYIIVSICFLCAFAKSVQPTVSIYKIRTTEMKWIDSHGQLQDIFRNEGVDLQDTLLVVNLGDNVVQIYGKGYEEVFIQRIIRDYNISEGDSIKYILHVQNKDQVLHYTIRKSGGYPDALMDFEFPEPYSQPSHVIHYLFYKN